MIDWRLNLRAVIGRAYPRVIGSFREPSWLFFDIFLPLLGIAAFAFYYQALGAPSVFIGFVILGGAMTAYWLNVLWSMAAQFYWEKEVGNLQLYLMAPMSRMSVLAGMALGGIFFTSVRALSTLALGLLIFGIEIEITSPISLLVVFFLTLFALYGMGMMFSSLYLLYGRGVWHLSSVFQEPIYFVSGFYFPVKALGFWVSLLASIVPITLGLDAMRQLIFAGQETMGFLPVSVEIVVLILLAVVFIYGARVALNFMENLGKREGRLTLRWQ
ncbi:MAG: ABC transporter permease [Methanomassiliicoccales archaeon]|nr:ABC transporter permease [Methanomassiliicoccales archaeon]